MRIDRSIGIGQDVDVYARPRVAAANTGDSQCFMRGHAVKAAAPAGPTFEPRSPRADDRPMSVDARPAGFGRACGPRSSWLEDALQTLADIDEEIAEDGLPEVSLPTKREAERIVGALATPPLGSRRIPHAGWRDRDPVQVPGLARLRGDPARRPRAGGVLRVHGRAQSACPLRRVVGFARRFRQGTIARHDSGPVGGGHGGRGTRHIRHGASCGPPDRAVEARGREVRPTRSC